VGVIFDDDEGQGREAEYINTTTGGQLMNESAIWVDRDSGTYFTRPPIEIATTEWNEYDHFVFREDMTDRQRCEYAEMVNDYFARHSDARHDSVLSPAEWLEEGTHQCQLCGVTDTKDIDADIQGNVCATCFEAMPVGEWVTR
jgi:hypothetical protein